MDKLNEAIKFAIDAHRCQTRKLDGGPYILHPMEVAVIVGGLTRDEDVICAAVLHDVVEDTPVTLEEVERTFGKRVADLVLGETEDKRSDLPPEATWKIRKEESLYHMKLMNDKDVELLWLGDKLANMRSILRNYMKIGDGVWEFFNQKDKREQEWYYRSVTELLRANFEGTKEFTEYEQIVKYIFK